MNTEIVSIESARQRLQVLPEYGGAVGAWDWKNGVDWLPLFRPWDGVCADRYTVSCFPLVPWSNRIGGGGFEHEGQFYPIHANRTEEHYPLHGDGWLQRWEVVERDDERIKIALESKHFDRGPYHYRSTQTFQLLPDGLQIDLTATHMGQGSLPFGLGLHPYFTCNAATRLQFRAEGVWLFSAESMPTDHTTHIPPDWDYNEPAALEGPLIDTCYTGWNGRATIDYPDRGLRLSMVMPDCNGYVLLYRKPDAGYFCLEPITHPVDAFHMPDQPGLVYLGHGESLALRAKFLVSERE
jgi:aldose 1-epimerase